MTEYMDLPTVLFFAAAYFLPAIVAHARRHRQVPAIFVLNLLLGWSVFGWIGALIWAVVRKN